jgi:hypothetical protein
MKFYIKILTALFILNSCSSNNKFDDTGEDEKITQKIGSILGNNGQQEFEAEGIKTPLGSVSRLYNFHYELSDTIGLFFTDSITVYSNPEKTIVKEIYLGIGSKKPSVEINYFRLNGQDSVLRHFTGNKLNRTYISKFDSLDRIKDYGWTEKTTGNDTLWGLTYEYRDSSTITGNILIQDSYVRYSLSREKEFQYMVLFYFDKKNRLFKEIRQGVWDDPRANIFNYSCSEKDSLISRKVEIMGIVDNISYTEKDNNSKFNQESKLTVFSPNFQNINLEIKNLINNNALLRKIDKYEQFHYKFSTSNNEIQIIFSKDLTSIKNKVQCIISKKIK